MGVFAGFFEEICQIHFPSSVFVFGESNRFDENFIVAIGVEKCNVYAAQVDEVQRGATHDEHRLKFMTIGHGRKVKDLSPLRVHFELADAADFSINNGFVGKCLGTEGNSAPRAEQLLLLFLLNR